MKQVISFKSSTDYLSPANLHQRGKSFTILPGETIIVNLNRCEKFLESVDKFMLSYLIKNVSKYVLKCKKVTLHQLLMNNKINYKMVEISNKDLKYLKNKSIRGLKTWYTLRKLFVISNLKNKEFQYI